MSESCSDSPVTVNGIKKKREELMKLRRSYQDKIREIDRDVITLSNALRLFEPDNYVSKERAEARSQNRSNHTRRLVLGILREATGPISARQVSDKLMAQEGAGTTSKDRRTWGVRVSAALQNAKVSGLTSGEYGPDGTILWTLTPNA